MMTNQKKVPLPPPSNRERLNEWSHRLRIREYWEAWHPIVLGVLVFLVVVSCRVGKAEFDRLLKDAAPTAVSVAAIFAGFQATVHAIMLSITKSRVVRHLQAKGKYDRLVDFVRSGIVSLLIFVGVALLVIVLCSLDACPPYFRFITAALIGLFSWALLASVRIMLLVVGMLKVAAGTRRE